MRSQRIQKESALFIQDFQIRRRLARRLPASIARSYHVIPVAADAGRITVAMVDPEDGKALAAVRDALGSEPYIVRGDQRLINAAIDQIWPNEIQQTQRTRILLQVYDRGSRKKNGDFHSQENTVYEFSQKLSSLLNAELIIFSATPENRADDLYHKVNQERYDLVICGKFTRADLGRIPTSMLVVQHPSWPLNKILLIINGEMYAEASVSWVVRLAKKSSAHVTALAVIPPVPGVFQGLSGMQEGLPELLNTNTQLGGQTRKIAQRLVDEEINGTIKLRYGSPETQYLKEAADEHYDMIIMAAESENRWKQWLRGELIAPLVQRSRSPLLIAKSM